MRPLPLFLLCASAGVQAADQAAPTSAGSLAQVLLGLIVVLGLMAGAAWMLRRLGLSQTTSISSTVKVVGGVNIGTRERILVVEVADQWIVVGVAPGRVNTLSTLPRQELSAVPDTAPVAKNFSTWLKQTIEKRNGQ